MNINSKYEEFIFLFVLLADASYCKGTHLNYGTNCSTVPRLDGCNNYFRFEWNYYAVPTYGAVLCEDPGFGYWCSDNRIL